MIAFSMKSPKKQKSIEPIAKIPRDIAVRLTKLFALLLESFILIFAKKTQMNILAPKNTTRDTMLMSLYICWSTPFAFMSRRSAICKMFKARMHSDAITIVRWAIPVDVVCGFFDTDSLIVGNLSDLNIR